VSAKKNEGYALAEEHLYNAFVYRVLTAFQAQAEMQRIFDRNPKKKREENEGEENEEVNYRYTDTAGKFSVFVCRHYKYI
jgi:hypothetical protein